MWRASLSGREPGTDSMTAIRRPDPRLIRRRADEEGQRDEYEHRRLLRRVLLLRAVVQYAAVHVGGVLSRQFTHRGLSR